MSLLPLDTPLEVDAELRCATYQPPLVVPVQITRFDGQRYELRLRRPEPDLQTGAHTTLVFGDVRIRALIVVEINELSVSVNSSRGPVNKRAFPRMFGSIHLRYRHIDAAAAEHHIRDWLFHISEPDDTWHSPDPFMNFSASGLRFQDEAPREIGDLLLLEMGIPTAPERWRATARVVRLEHDGEGKSFVAVRFLDLPAEAQETLQRFTHRLQEVIG